MVIEGEETNPDERRQGCAWTNSFYRRPATWHPRMRHQRKQNPDRRGVNVTLKECLKGLDSRTVRVYVASRMSARYGFPAPPPSSFHSPWPRQQASNVNSRLNSIPGAKAREIARKVPSKEVPTLRMLAKNHGQAFFELMNRTIAGGFVVRTSEQVRYGYY